MKSFFLLAIAIFLLCSLSPVWGDSDADCSANECHLAFCRESGKSKELGNWSKEFWYSCTWGKAHCAKIKELERKIAALEKEITQITGYAYGKERDYDI